jgi:CRISPR system Cascade subunit CasE
VSAVLTPSAPDIIERVAALTLVKLRPDGAALARWAAASGVAAFRDDLGYAAHAASRAVFGDLAPKPFALRLKAGGLEMVGYCAASVDELSRVACLQTHDDAAAHALGVDGMVVKSMPLDWAAGERFSFECRVVPTRRTRQSLSGRYVELDAAIPDSGPESDSEAAFDRDAAYSAWLSRELSRFSAARLTGYSPFAFKLTPTARRTQADQSNHATQRSSGAGARRPARGLVPDLVARGELEVVDPSGFREALRRGLGRHRAFGYGCILLAPRGVLYAARDAERRLRDGA